MYMYACVCMRVHLLKSKMGKRSKGRRIATEIDKKEIGKTEISRIFKIWLVRAQLLMIYRRSFSEKKYFLERYREFD